MRRRETSRCTASVCVCDPSVSTPFKHTMTSGAEFCPKGRACPGQDKQVCSRHGEDVRFTCLLFTDRPSTINALLLMQNKEEIVSFGGGCRIREVPATCLLDHAPDVAPRCAAFFRCARPDLCPYQHDKGALGRAHAAIGRIRKTQERARAADGKFLAPCMDGLMCTRQGRRGCMQWHGAVCDRPLCRIPMCDLPTCTFAHADGHTYIGALLVAARPGQRAAGMASEKPVPLLNSEEFPPLARRL